MCRYNALDKPTKMKSIFVLLTGLLAGFLALQSQAQPPAPQLGKNSIREVVAAMTLEEKARLVVGMGFRMGATITPQRNNRAPGSKDSAASQPAFVLPPVDSADRIPEKVPGAAGRTHAIPRLGIPSITLSDGPAGIRITAIRKSDSSRTYYATAFPSATLLASSWDTAMVRKLGESFGNEIREYGADIILGPAMNIQRNPLGGRNFEYYSEDPLVSGSIGAAIVTGIQSQGVGTSVKHFIANNQETNRNSVNTIVSERALREIYLRGFEITIKKSKPWTVMTSYNRLNGTYTSERRDLVTTILRDEWKYKGTVMTDWFGGSDPVAQMNAGNDLLMPGTSVQTKKIIAAVDSGRLDIKQLDENVTRILQLVLLSPEFKKYKYSDKPDLVAHAAVDRAAATEGMILLKNDGSALPITKGLKIAVYGNASYDIIAGGTGSGDVNKAYKISLVKGLTDAGYAPDPTIATEYENHIAAEKAKRPPARGFSFLPPAPLAQLVPDGDALQQEATGNDIAIFTLGRVAGEGIDRKVKNDYSLTDTERLVIKNISDAFHAKGKKLVVLLNVGGVVEVTSWRDQADAILLTWQPGLEAGHSIADVLSGKVDPSGKLAVTFPLAYTDDPTAKNFPGKEFPDPAGQPASFMRGKPSEVIYEEGIYVGYRYYNTFKIQPAYPFGYGLSYTKFSYGKLSLSATTLKGKLTASVTVTNSGKTAGREIVQLYVSAPAAKLDKPESELRAFAKTKLLAPGESQTLVFSITPQILASFDTPSSSWITESGKYTVKIGASSIDIRSTGSFTVPANVVVEKVNKVLVPAVSISELKH